MTLILNYTDEADVIYIFLHAMSSRPETKFLPIYLGTYLLPYFSTRSAVLYKHYHAKDI